MFDMSDGTKCCRPVAGETAAGSLRCEEHLKPKKKLSAEEVAKVRAEIEEDLKYFDDDR
jgi:hypothetical protein